MQQQVNQLQRQVEELTRLLEEALQWIDEKKRQQISYPIDKTTKDIIIDAVNHP